MTKVKRVLLKENKGDYAPICELTYTTNGAFNFVCYNIIGWNDTTKKRDKEFLVKGSVNWEGESALIFGGEDYPSEKNGYYQWGGAYSYIENMQIMQFILEQAFDELERTGSYVEREELESLQRYGLLKDIEVIEEEVIIEDLKELQKVCNIFAGIKL